MTKCEEDEKSPNGEVVIDAKEMDRIHKFVPLTKAADFEAAISATGFGKFNIILMLLAIPAGWSSNFETTTMSYVLPAAQCDLDLTLANKGSLNAISYAGMISSAFIWGFLCDVLGRKKLLVAGFLLDAMFVVLSALSQNVTMLMLSKFLGGFVINGPFAALSSYLAEFHSAKHRARIQLFIGITISVGNVILPLLAWAILPLALKFQLGPFSFYSWNVYLLMCSLPAMISAIGFFFLPESPKFLMTMGKNQEALEVFRTVYTCNTGKAKELYKIKELIEEKEQQQKTLIKESRIQVVRKGCRQMVPLFLPPFLAKITLVCSMQGLFMMGVNTLRLWLPQIFQAINDYKHDNNGSTATLCTMISSIRPRTANLTDLDTMECSVNLDNSSVYINSIIVAVVTIIGYIGAGILINSIGKKRLLIILGTLSGTCSIAMFFATDSLTAVILSSLFVCLSSICIIVVLAVVVDLFPTTLRTMTVALTMMLGRSGAMLGNLIFPALITAGCAPPFFFVGSVLIGCAVLSCFLPNTDMKALQ